MIKNMYKRVVSVAMAGFTLVSAATYTACTKKPSVDATTPTIGVDTEKDNSFKYEEEMVDSTIAKINELDLNFDKEVVVKDAALLLLLSEIAKKDENDKISSDVMAHFKNVVNEQNMMNNYDDFLDKIENAMIIDEKFISVSSVLPDNMLKEKNILGTIEHIAEYALQNRNDKQAVLDSFDKMYTLFVDEKEVDGVKKGYLPYSLQSAASSYAREVNDLARYWASEGKRADLDSHTNDQRSKSDIINILGKISNQMEDVSLDKQIVERFNHLYSSFNEKITPYITSNIEAESQLINYINLDYLTSEDVAPKDRKELVGEYDEEIVRNVLDLIDAISKRNADAYAINGESANIFGLEKLLINANEQDVLAIRFVQSNSYMLLSSIDENVTLDSLFGDKEHPTYFDKLVWYTTKTPEFEHSYRKGDKDVVKETISYQNISKGVRFVCDEIVRYTFSILKGKQHLTEDQIFSNYYDQSERNVVDSIKYIQNNIGECTNVDAKEYIR